MIGTAEQKAARHKVMRTEFHPGQALDYDVRKAARQSGQKIAALSRLFEWEHSTVGGTLPVAEPLVMT
jgi:hypothetical protein